MSSTGSRELPRIRRGVTTIVAAGMAFALLGLIVFEALYVGVELRGRAHHRAFERGAAALAHLARPAGFTRQTTLPYCLPGRLTCLTTKLPPTRALPIIESLVNARPDTRSCVVGAIGRDGVPVLKATLGGYPAEVYVDRHRTGTLVTIELGVQPAGCDD